MAKRRSTSVRIAGAIVAGAATIGVIPMLPAVGKQSPPVGGNSPAKVAVCHKPGSPAQKTLMLPRPAVEAHIGHGDTPGPCPGTRP